MVAGVGEGDVVFVVTVENATAAGLMAARTDINRATNQIANDVGTNFANVGNMVKGVEESFRRLGNTLVGAGGAITGTFTLPLVLGFRSLIDAGVDFETEIQRVVSLFAEADKPIANTKKEVIEFAQAMALTSQYSATEVAKAMYMMGQAGYNLTEVYQAIPNILNLATAQQYEVAGTFGIVNTVLKSYQLSAGESLKITNQLAAAATMFNLTMDDYNAGLKYVLGTSKSLDMQLSEVLVTFGLLTDRGFKGMQAGRILRDVISDLVAPVGTANAVIEKYNLQLYKNQGEMNSAANAVSAATYKLDMMKRGTTGTSQELAALNMSIAQNNALLSQAKISGNIVDVQNLTRANQDLKDTYSILSAKQRVTNADIAAQQKYTDELTDSMKDVTIKGIVPFSQIIKEIADKGLEVGEIYELFGKQSGAGIVALVDLYKSNNEAFNEYISQVETSNAAEAQAAIQKQSTAFEVKRLREALDQLRVEGYMALAPIIATINEFLLKNMDTLKMLVREFIEGFLPALNKIFGVVQGFINWFAKMDDAHRKTLLRIIAGGAVFMAAVGPILLYIGSISWAIASFLKLGRGIADSIILVGKLIAKFLLASEASYAFAGSVMASNKMIEATTASTLMLNPSLVATGTSFGFVETSAMGATGALSTVGASLIAILPYLAIAGVVIYALYWAWKNNFGGMADATELAGQYMIKSIDEGIRPALVRLKRDLSMIKEGSGDLVKGLLDADPYQIAYSVAKLAGSIGAAIMDMDAVWRGFGTAIMKAIATGMTGGDALKSFESDMKEIISLTRMGEAGAAGWTEGFSGGRLTYVNKGLQVTTRGLNDAIDAQIALDKSNKTLTNSTNNQTTSLKNYHAELANITPKLYGINTTANRTAYEFGSANKQANGLIVSILKIPKAKSPLGDKNFNATAGRNSALSLVDGYNTTLNSSVFGEGIDLTSAEEIMKATFGNIGEESGTLMGENTIESFINTISDPALKKQLENAFSSALPSISPNVQAPPMVGGGGSPAMKTYSWKEATLGGMTEIGDLLYKYSDVSAAAGAEKSYGDYRNLTDIVKNLSPAGVLAGKAAPEMPTPTSAAAAATGTVLEAMAPTAAVGGGVTNIANQFNISTYVYPKEAMNSSEIDSLGTKITAMVESKLGEKYRNNEAV